MGEKNIDCCANCKHCIVTPKNNKYGDMEYFCMKIGYYCTGVHKDVHKYKHLSPGGRELDCQYERRGE